MGSLCAGSNTENIHLSNDSPRSERCKGTLSKRVVRTKRVIIKPVIRPTKEQRDDVVIKSGQTKNNSQYRISDLSQTDPGLIETPTPSDTPPTFTNEREEKEAVEEPNIENHSPATSKMLSSSILRMSEEEEGILHALFRSDSISEDVSINISSNSIESDSINSISLKEESEIKTLEITGSMSNDTSSVHSTASSDSDSIDGSLSSVNSSPYQSFEHISQEDQDLLSAIFGEEESVDFEAALNEQLSGQSNIAKYDGDHNDEEDIVTHKPSNLTIEENKNEESDLKWSEDNENSDLTASSPISGTFDRKKLVIEEKISSGGYGIVSKGKYHHAPNRVIDVAIKEMKILNAKELRNVEHEINLQEKLNHPNVLGCLGSWFEGNRGFVVLELCEKGDLSKYKLKLKSSRTKLIIIEKIAKGMQYLHERNIIHRDLKSQNILITADKKIKICDFGTSKSVDSFKQSFVGTVEYIPAEIVFGKVDDTTLESDPKLIDVYSFGILMWEIWTGGQPFAELRKRIPNPYPLLREIHTNKRRPSLEDPLIISMPSKLRRLMIQCWEHAPEKRPQDFEIILRRIKKIRKSSKKSKKKKR